MSFQHGGLSFLVLWGLASCFQAPISTSGAGGCPGCRVGGSTGAVHKTTGSGGSGGTSGGSSASGTAGSGSTGSAGGSSSGGSSSTGGLDDAGCPTPLLELDARIYDLAGNTPIVGADVSAITLNGVPISSAEATSRADGTFTLCVPGGVEVAPLIQATGYPLTYIENFELTQPLTALAGRQGIPMLSTELLDSFASFLPIDTTQAAVTVGVTSVSRTAPCVGNAAGWTIALDLPDGGGPLPDGGAQLYYTSSSDIPTPGLSVTAANGIALFFNIDTSYSNILSIEASNPDAGPCGFDLASLSLTGRIYVSQGAMTISVLPTP